MIFHVGPPGRLFALREIEHDTEPSVATAAPGGEFTSLSGRRSRDRTGPYRRTWQLEWRYWGREDVALLDALRRGHLGGPLRLIDPQWPNLLPAQIATAGTELRSVAGWSTVAGSLRWIRPDGLPDGLLAVGAVEWTKASGADDLTTGRTDASYRVPAPPDGGPVALGAYLHRGDSPAAVQVVPGVDSWSAAGARTTTLAAARAASGTWTDATASLTLPGDAVEWAPMWRIAAGTAATVQVAGVRAGLGEVAPGADLGGGSAEVLISAVELTYPGQDEMSYTVTFEEC